MNRDRIRRRARLVPVATVVWAIAALAWGGPMGHAQHSDAPAKRGTGFLDDVSTWYSQVELHGDHTRFNGRYIDGSVIGNGQMLCVEGMTTDISRFRKSRVTDSRLHGMSRFKPGDARNGFVEHQSRSPKSPLHAFTWIAGPVYTEFPIAHGFTTRAEYSIPAGSRVIEPSQWPRETQYRIRRTNIVKNVLETDAMEITMVDFMPPGKPGLIRHITVANRSDEAIERARLVIRFHVDPRNWADSSVTRAKAGNELTFYERRVTVSPTLRGQVVPRSVLIDVPTGDEKFGRFMLVHTPERSATVDKSFVEFDVGTLAPGESQTLSILMVTAFDEKGLAETFAELTATPVVPLLEQTYAWWTARLAEADALAEPLPAEVPQQTLDYVDGVRTFLLSLHNEAGGSIAHPYTYNHVYLRDGYETFRAMLELGHRDEARRTIEFFQEAIRRFGVRMSYAPEAMATTDPSTTPPAEADAHGNFVKSEYMLFFPMMVRDFTERCGDAALAAAAYPTMKRMLESQPIEGDGLVAYSGDELSVKRGKPLYRYSPQNAALYVQAAEFVASVASDLGHNDDAAALNTSAQEVRAAIERQFWLEEGFYAYSADGHGRTDPRLNIFCQALPYFYGFLTPDDPRLHTMLDNVLRHNVYPNARVATLPIGDRRKSSSNGNCVGLLLSMMSLAGYPDAEPVMQRLLADAGTMGTTGEYIFVSNASITRGEMLRPYETSFNLYATLQYLRKRAIAPQADPLPTGR